MARTSCMRWIRRENPATPFANKELGAERLSLEPNDNRQAEIDAIYTIGREMRETRLSAYSSLELAFERRADDFGQNPLDAFEGCEIDSVEVPISRGHFFQGPLDEFILKGGKKDRKNGENVGLSQISFLKWLCSLEPKTIDKILVSPIGRQLSEFEKQSFGQLDWFKSLANELKSDENLPDGLHIWTAERNEIDFFLTLDQRLINQIDGIVSRRKPFELSTRVVSPLQLLDELGVPSLGSPPIEPNRLYYFTEIPQRWP